jgi:hypothetical protein
MITASLAVSMGAGFLLAVKRQPSELLDELLGIIVLGGVLFALYLMLTGVAQ